MKTKLLIMLWLLSHAAFGQRIHGVFMSADQGVYFIQGQRYEVNPENYLSQAGQKVIYRTPIAGHHVKNIRFNSDSVLVEYLTEDSVCLKQYVHFNLGYIVAKSQGTTNNDESEIRSFNLFLNKKKIIIKSVMIDINNFKISSKGKFKRKHKRW